MSNNQKISSLKVKTGQNSYSDPYEFSGFAENILLNRETNSANLADIINNSALIKTEIPSNTDLNNLIAQQGIFVSPDSTRTSTLINCPMTGAGFVLWVEHYSEASETGYIQRLQNGGATPNLYIRAKYSSGWTPWFNQNNLALGNVIPANSDLNDYVIPGVYRCGSEATAATLSNCPSNIGFVMQVRYNYASDYLFQFVYPNDGQRTYRRRIKISDKTTTSWVLAESFRIDVSSAGTIEDVIDYCTTPTSYTPANLVHYARFQGGANALFGAASFTAMFMFSSSNYGWIVCFSDNATQSTPIYIPYSSGNYVVNRLESPANFGFLKQLTASDNLATMNEPGYYKIYNAIPLNAPVDILSSQKYGYLCIYKRTSSGYIYYDLVAGQGSFSNQDRWIGWKKDTATSGISWKCLTKGNRIEIAENTDLDNLTAPGFYACTTAAISGTLLNKPDGLDSALFVMNVYQVDASNSQLLQHIMTGSNGGQNWIRQKTGSTWTSWINTNNLSLGTEISNDTDLNNLTDIGIYRCTTNAVARTLLNCPTEKAFLLENRLNRTSSTKMQIIYDWMGYNIWIRSATKTGSTWAEASFDNWNNLASTSMLKEWHIYTIAAGKTYKVTTSGFCYIVVTANLIEREYAGLWIGNVSKITEFFKGSYISVSQAENGFYITNNHASGAAYLRTISPYDATLEQVTSSVAIIKQPESVVCIPDEKIAFTLTAKNATSYQWEWSSDKGTTWQNTTVAGNKTNTLTPQATEARIGNIYRCKISDGTNTIYSNAVNFIRKTIILENPENVSAIVGDTITLKVLASGSNLTYQWQYINKTGSYWANCTSPAGYNTASFSFPITAPMKDRKYRCIVSGDGGTEVSTAITITFVTPPDPQPEIETNEKKILFIGDSYCEGYSHDGNNNGWAWLAGQYLGLTGTKESSSNYNNSGTVDASSSDSYERMYRGGAKFYNATAGTGYTFIELLNEAHNQRFPNYEFTDIICCGGYNDRQNTKVQILSAIEAFVNQAKTYYPDANIYIGHIGFNKKGSSSDTTVAPTDWLQYRKHMKEVSIPAYRECTKYGAIYLNNVEYALNESHMTNLDGYHPSEQGNKAIARAVAKAFLYGSAPISYTDSYYYYTSVRRKFLFLGDSYCEGYTHSTYNEGWAKYCGDSLGLATTIVNPHSSQDSSNAANDVVDASPNDDYERLYIGGARFYHTSYTSSGRTFLQLLNKAYSTKFPDYDFTDIVACAGFGDRLNSQENILDGIQRFTERAKQLYPNCNVYIGHVSWIKQGNDTSLATTDWVTAQNNLQDHVLPAYQKCALYGAKYLVNVQFAIGNSGIMDDDGYCANEEGNRSIGIAIANAITTGSAPMPTKHKKYLFLGDSYLQGYSNNSTYYNDGWGIYCGNALGLSTTDEQRDSNKGNTSSNLSDDAVDASFNDDYERLFAGGARFAWGTQSETLSFKHMIQQAATVKFPGYKFTDIVVCAGYGDRTYTKAEILTGIEAFVKMAKQYYPDANIYIGQIAWIKQGTNGLSDWSTMRSNIETKVIPAYQQCSQHGARYLNNVEYWINDDGLNPYDGYHPNETGNKNLGYAIANALMTGSAPLPYKNTYRLS